MKKHYRNQVLWDDTGGPVTPYSDTYKKSNHQKQIHTKYFFVHGYTKINLLAIQSLVDVPSDPFTASKKPKRLEHINNEDTASMISQTEEVENLISGETEIIHATEPTIGIESESAVGCIVAVSDNFGSFEAEPKGKNFSLRKLLFLC